MSQGKDVCNDITCLVSNMAITLPVDEKKTNSYPIPSDDDFIMHPNEYEIVAFVDISLVTKDVSEEDIREEFRHSKVEIQPLRIGDCMWMAQRCVTTTDTKDKTLVLPYIAFKDDKLLEEKFRSQCRDCGFKRVLRIKETSLCPLADSVHVAHNIHRIGEFHYFETVTGSQIGTIGYLADLTSRLNKSFQGKTLRSCRRECLPHIFSSQLNTLPLVTWKELFSSLS